jgi:hypothetical protein
MFRTSSSKATFAATAVALPPSASICATVANVPIVSFCTKRFPGFRQADFGFGWGFFYGRAKKCYRPNLLDSTAWLQSFSYRFRCAQTVSAQKKSRQKLIIVRNDAHL